MVSKWDGLNIFQQYDDDIYIVGEAHNSYTSESLVWNILEGVEPNGIAIEQSPIYDSIPPRFSNTGGISRAYHYSKSTNIPVALIDENITWMKSNTNGNSSEIIRVANSPQNQQTEVGDFYMNTIMESRNLVRDNFGIENYEAIFIKREQNMARRILGFNERVSGPIVAVVGGFHVHAIIEFLDLVDANIEDRRISESQHYYHRWRNKYADQIET